MVGPLSVTPILVTEGTTHRTGPLRSSSTLDPKGQVNSPTKPDPPSPDSSGKSWTRGGEES